MMKAHRPLNGYEGQHEKIIERHFKKATRYCDDITIFNFPITILCFTNRCGSNLLGEHLRATGNFHGFYEHLNHDVVEELSYQRGSDTFPNYLKTLAAEKTNDCHSYGIKASWDQLLMLLKWNIPAMFSGIRIIHIERRDVVAQAVSFSIAAQTKKWTSLMKGETTNISYDFDDILNRINGIGEGNRLIKTICSIYDHKRIMVDYDEISGDCIPTLSRIHTELKIPFTKLNLPNARLEKQADKLNEEFCLKFKSDFKRKITQNR